MAVCVYKWPSQGLKQLAVFNVASARCFFVDAVEHVNVAENLC